MATRQDYSRAYAGPQDLQAMLDLLRRRQPGRASDFPGFIDLQEMLAVPKIQAVTRLWIDPDGRLACFAILEMDQSSAALVFEVKPGLNEPKLV